MKSSQILIPVALLAVLTAGCSKPHATPAESTAALPAAKVSLVTIRAEELPLFTEITGTVRPVQRAALAAKVMGTVESLPVTLGQSVKAGDVLLRISANEISARLAQAQSQLNLAERDLGRERDLLTKGASTAEMVRGLEDRAAMTAAVVREAETMLGYTQLRAPFDGVITRKHVDAGDLAAPGQPLIEIEGAGSFEIATSIPDSLAGPLATGAEIIVNVPGSTTPLTGKISELSSAADAQARTVSAKIALPAGSPVRSGQFVRVQLPGAPVRLLLAPVSAVSVLGQMERVFVADSNKRAVLRLVKTGAVRDGRVEILSGLDDGERVVVAPPAGLREGQSLDLLP